MALVVRRGPALRLRIEPNRQSELVIRIATETAVLYDERTLEVCGGVFSLRQRVRQQELRALAEAFTERSHQPLVPTLAKGRVLQDGGGRSRNAAVDACGGRI